jgi:hypothetical protein
VLLPFSDKEPTQLSPMDIRINMRQDIYRGRAKCFISCPELPDRFEGPPVECVLWVLYFRVKRREREADHSPPSSVEIKNALSCSTFSTG